MPNHQPRPRPWLPCPYEVADVAAIKALAAGEADENAQKRALRWIIHQAAGYSEGTPYRSDDEGGDRDTTFALGRRYVGDHILKLVDMPPNVVAKLRKHDGDGTTRDPDKPRRGAPTESRTGS